MTDIEYLRQIAALLNDDAAGYLLNPDQYNRQDLPFSNAVRAALDQIRNNLGGADRQRLGQLRYVVKDPNDYSDDLRAVYNIQDEAKNNPDPNRQPVSGLPSYAQYTGVGGAGGSSGGFGERVEEERTGGMVRPGRVEPATPVEDPLGRGTDTAGFGRGPDAAPVATLYTGSDERDIRIRLVAKYLNEGAQEYLRRFAIAGRYDRLALPQGVSAAGRAVLNRLLEGEDLNPSELTSVGLAATDRGTGRNLQAAFNEVDTIIADREAPRPYYDPIASGIVFLNPTEAETRGLAGTELDQEAVARQYGTGAEDIEPGELSRLGPGASPGFVTATEQEIIDLLIPGASGQADQVALEQYYGSGVSVTPSPTVTTTPGVGGGGGYGGISDVSAEPTALDQAIPEDWRTAAREAYPGYYAIIRNIPEIAELLEKAIAVGFTDEEFQAQLEQTNWWKQTTASAREWDINGERDPASQQTAIDNRVALIRQAALDNFGVRLGAESLNELATDSLRLGWSQQFLLNAIGDVATQSTAGISQLRAGYVGQQLRRTANDYGIAVSDATFNKFVNQIAVGQETQDSFQQYALTQAKNLFPSVSDRLDAGETFQQIVDPYREQAARLLEIDPDDIDFTQSEYIKALTYQDERGEQRPMSFTEFGDYIRQTRSFGYEYTDQARNKAYQVANQLANLFGKA